MDDYTTSALYPLKIAPLFLDKIWGGQALRKKLNKQIPDSAKIGESWEISGLESKQTVVADGQLKGCTIEDLCGLYGDKLLGKNISNGKFPLLFKFIDANDKLSVQVHPDDCQARHYHFGNGKTECWYIVDAPPGTSIIVGLKKSISESEMHSAIVQGTFSQLLKEELVTPGDLLFIPAGTIHAIMSKTLLYEVQQSADITFRVYDWDRVDESGKARPLHIDDAIRVCDRNAYESYKVCPVQFSYDSHIHSFRVGCSHFVIEQYSFINNTPVLIRNKNSFQTLTVIKGGILLSSSTGETAIETGESILLPAEIKNAYITAKPGSELLLTYVPNLKEDIVNYLYDKNVPESDILKLGGIVPEKNDILKLLR